MHYEIIGELRAPDNRLPLELASGAFVSNGEITEGALVEPQSNRKFPIHLGIPRFVPRDNYASSFGLQWNKYRRTQIDRFNGSTLTRERFFRGTGWSPEELAGQKVLEAGCGAGRFTQILLDAGAQVYSFDYSDAVDACYANNGPHPRLNLIQANIYQIPFPVSYFDRVFCFGVLQHTPDVKRSFLSLVPYLKPEGKLAIDVYLKPKRPRYSVPKYLWRPLTKRMPRPPLLRFLEWYVPRIVPIDNALRRIPKAGRLLGYMLAMLLPPVWNYTGKLPLSYDKVVEWSILDTFDGLSPKYDSPQTIDEVRSWFEEAGLRQIEVRLSGDGRVLGTATK